MSYAAYLVPSFRGHFLFPCFNTYLLCFFRYSWHYPPWGMKYHRCFTYFSDIQVGLLEDEKWKIMSRKLLCPAEHSRQGYSGSCYSNKVCDINRADVKSLFTLYKILWKYTLLGKRHESNYIPFHSHHQFLFFHPIRTSLTLKSNTSFFPSTKKKIPIPEFIKLYWQ